jgi:NSS family neurotransmitter:Na+ symporter
MVAYENGGGAFLIPYIVALITAGVPLMILEYALGQHFQKSSPGSLGDVKPGFAMIGWWALGVGAVISFYYAVIMGWSWDYLVFSFTQPWKGGAENAASFFAHVLRRSSGPGDVGGVSWPVLAGLAVTWATIYWIIKKGVLRVGKVVMITVPLPALLTLLILIRGVTLPGSIEGLRWYLTPDFSAILNGQTWLQAYAQVFFSLSLGFGILTAYASYLPKRSDISNNAFITSFADAGFAYFAGFSVFSVLGYLAQAQGVAVCDVCEGGPGLAFIVYPTALSLMPAAPLLAAAFFLTLLTLGIDSAFSIVEGVVAGLRDKWHISQSAAAGGFCVFGFVVGLVFTTGAGLYWLDIVDHWMNNYGLVVIGFLECIAIGWFYGTRRLKAYINEVSDFRVGLWWDIFIKWITPLALGSALVVNIVQEIQIPYEGYPRWALYVGGWGVVAVIIAVAWIITALPGSSRKEEG